MKEFRPRIPQTESWKELIDFAREYGAQDVLEAFLRSKNNTKESIDRTEDGADYIISSQSERIKTLEDLVDYCEIDEAQYEIYRYISNKYDQHSVEKGLVELFQVKAWMKKKYLDKPDASYYNNWLDGLEKVLPPANVSYATNEEDPIVLTIADMHCGAWIEGDHLSPSYNVAELKERIRYIADYVNATGRPVVLFILGDFIESFTGKSHKNTWKQIELHGMEVALEAYDITRMLIEAINEFMEVKIVGGNHDRISSSNEDDKQGQVAYLITEMLKRSGIDAEFHDRIISTEIDKVQYILTHGDKKITKKQPSDMVFEYGNQNLFNVILNAHGHEELIHKNSVKYQARQVPPIVVGGKYSKDLGVTANSGFTITYRSERTGVVTTTVPL